MNGGEKSDPAIVARKPANKAGYPVAERVERRAGAEGNARKPRTDRAQHRAVASPGLARIRAVVKERKGERFTTLLHHIDVDLLGQADRWLKRDAAAGVDGMTWAAYGEGLAGRLADLHGRMHRGSYRAQPSRRTYIPKPDGRQRPLGVVRDARLRHDAALEDKVVQRAVVEVLNAIYETDFLGFSYGFRPERGQHDALDALAVGIESQAVNWIVGADIRSFFDSIDHTWMMLLVEHRIGDRRVLRLIRKWLTVGVVEEGVRHPATKGTPQGAVISPLLANITLHYAYDLWVRQWRKRHARGAMIVVRYADDTVVGFEHPADRAPGRCRAVPGGTTCPVGGVRPGTAPREDPADRVRQTCRARPDGPGGGQTGDFRLPGFHPHLHAHETWRLHAVAAHTARAQAGEAPGNHGRPAAPLAPGRRRTGPLAGQRDARIFRIPSRSRPTRAPWARSAITSSIFGDAPCAGAANEIARPGPTWPGASDPGPALPAQAQDHSPLAGPAIPRQIPKVGAVCGNAARTVLCGGRAVMRVPTAIQHPTEAA